MKMQNGEVINLLYMGGIWIQENNDTFKMLFPIISLLLCVRMHFGFSAKNNLVFSQNNWLLVLHVWDCDSLNLAPWVSGFIAANKQNLQSNCKQIVLACQKKRKESVLMSPERGRIGLSLRHEEQVFPGMAVFIQTQTRGDYQGHLDKPGGLEAMSMGPNDHRQGVQLSVVVTVAV